MPGCDFFEGMVMKAVAFGASSAEVICEGGQSAVMQASVCRPRAGSAFWADCDAVATWKSACAGWRLHHARTHHRQGARRTRGVIGDGEIIFHACAANTQVQLEHQPVIRQLPRPIAGEIVIRRIEAIKVVLRAKLSQCEQTHAVTRPSA